MTYNTNSPVSKDVAKLTNVSWTIDGRSLERDLQIDKVVIINDLLVLDTVC